MQRRTIAVIATAILVACSSSSSSSSGGSGDGGADAGGSRNIGEACSGTSDCLAGLLCAGEDPGGQCYKSCGPSKDSDCGDTSKYACSSEGHCYLKCNTTSDCPRAKEGYACKDDDPPRGVKFCDVADEPADGGGGD